MEQTQRLRRVIWLATAITSVLIAAIISFAFRAEDVRFTTTLLARAGPSGQPRAQELVCDRVSAGHVDFIDGPGGSQTPDAEMDAWLRVNTYDFTLSDVVRVDRSRPNEMRAKYELRNDAGETIATFDTNYIGDSWHVNFWETCHPETEGMFTFDEEPPP